MWPRTLQLRENRSAHQRINESEHRDYGLQMVLCVCVHLTGGAVSEGNRQQGKRTADEFHGLDWFGYLKKGFRSPANSRAVSDKTARAFHHQSEKLVGRKGGRPLRTART